MRFSPSGAGPSKSYRTSPETSGRTSSTRSRRCRSSATDNASKPFRQLYLQSDFETAPLITSSMADTSRREFRDLCGLSNSDAKAMVAQLQAVNAESVPFEESIAEAGKLKLTKKKVPKARYVALSRVTFDPTNQYAWLVVDLSGGQGAIVRLDKVGGHWTRTSKCGGWMRSE